MNILHIYSNLHILQENRNYKGKKELLLKAIIKGFENIVPKESLWII